MAIVAVTASVAASSSVTAAPVKCVAHNVRPSPESASAHGLGATAASPATVSVAASTRTILPSAAHAT